MVKTRRIVVLGACLAFLQGPASTTADALAGLGYGGSRGGAAGGGSAPSHAGGGTSAGSGPSSGATGSPQGGGRGVPSQGVNGSYVSQEMSSWAQTHLHAPGAPAIAQPPVSAQTNGPGMQAVPAVADVGSTKRSDASQGAGQAMPAFRGGFLGALAGGLGGE